MDKKEFRSLMLKNRDSLKDQYMKKANEGIFNEFIKSDLYKNSKNIFIFVSYKKEVDTHKIIKYALKENKNMYVPIVNRQTKLLEVSKLSSFDVLKESYMGILEPDKEDYNLVDPNIIDLVVTPGLAFDRSGYRIGYGGGFYDKFFASLNSSPVKMGIGFNKQLVEAVVHDTEDQTLDYFLSENGLCKLGGN
ncbi:5-formyltetrahydrofolate cyclo-ligase [Peptoniphilus catoniae]|uniref:5-formyltetrahydrofolate cyclo-ligase n=1 Tax=Peptoniphilus catoniae TaxID=1660341 RepID=UPI0010FD45FC|nr:5-formyltetrahydrofolate cyclo-ligase [Peptoniphilus catoniae]